MGDMKHRDAGGRVWSSDKRLHPSVTGVLEGLRVFRMAASPSCRKQVSSGSLLPRQDDRHGYRLTRDELTAAPEWYCLKANG